MTDHNPPKDPTPLSPDDTWLFQNLAESWDNTSWGNDILSLSDLKKYPSVKIINKLIHTIPADILNNFRQLPYYTPTVGPANYPTYSFTGCKNSTPVKTPAKGTLLSPKETNKYLKLQYCGAICPNCPCIQGIVQLFQNYPALVLNDLIFKFYHEATKKDIQLVFNKIEPSRNRPFDSAQTIQTTLFFSTLLKASPDMATKYKFTPLLDATKTASTKQVQKEILSQKPTPEAAKNLVAAYSPLRVAYEDFMKSYSKTCTEPHVIEVFNKAFAMFDKYR